jgi:hypothetical protein
VKEVERRKMGRRNVFQCGLVKDPMKRSWKMKIFGLSRDMHLLQLISR